MSLAGVIGYEPRNSGRPDLTAAATNPNAVALLPVILRYSPGAIRAAGTSYELANISVVSP